MTNPNQGGDAGVGGDVGPGVGGDPGRTAESDATQDEGYGHCLRCGTPVEAVGIESFLVGGTSGGWHMFLGNLADLGEGTLDFEIFACPSCRKVELRVPVQ